MSCHRVGSMPGCLRKPPLNHWNMGDGPTSWLQVKPDEGALSGEAPSASAPLVPPVSDGGPASAGSTAASGPLEPALPEAPPTEVVVVPPVPGVPPLPPVGDSS